MPDKGFSNAHDAAKALRRMTMAEMRSLLAIKAAGNLSRAALELGVSQPALSQHIRQLENKLDLTLFIRQRRGLVATPYGTVLLRLAAAMQADIGIAADELAIASREDRPPLRIGSMPVTSGGLLAVAMSRFASDPRNPPTVLLEGLREELLEHLRNRRIDLFVGRLTDDDDKSRDLQRELLLQDNAVVIASARHPLGRRSRLGMQALTGYPWILPAEDSTFHRQIADSMRQAGLPLPVARITTYSMLSFPAVVSTSQMLGFLPTSLFASGTLTGSLQRLPVALHWTPSPIGIMTRRDAEIGQDLQTLIRLLRAVAASANSASLSR